VTLLSGAFRIGLGTETSDFADWLKGFAGVFTARVLPPTSYGGWKDLYAPLRDNLNVDNTQSTATTERTEFVYVAKLVLTNTGSPVSRRVPAAYPDNTLLTSDTSIRLTSTLSVKEAP
jgi:hypothetical protein